MTHHDLTLIERLAGVAPGSPVGRAFRARPEARAQSERSYQLLLFPEVAGPVSLLERRAVAAFVAALQDEPETRAHFLALLRQTDAAPAPLARLIAHEADGSAHPGPYGAFPEGPLSAESLDGPVYVVDDATRLELGERLSAALEHAHLLALHPRDAGPEALEALLRAGWTRDGIVVLTQVIGLVSFQVRVVAGLRSYLAARQASLLAAE